VLGSRPYAQDLVDPHPAVAEGECPADRYNRQTRTPSSPISAVSSGRWRSKLSSHPATVRT
jgi:hypothetical protein